MCVSVCVFVYMNYITYILLQSDEFINITPSHIFKEGGGNRNLYAQAFSFIKILVF